VKDFGGLKHPTNNQKQNCTRILLKLDNVLFIIKKNDFDKIDEFEIIGEMTYSVEEYIKNCSSYDVSFQKVKDPDE